MLETKIYYAVDREFSFAVTFLDRSLSFERRYDLTRINVFYTEMTNKVLFDQRGNGWVEN